ncbi:MAG: DNA polymerase III subunit delta', partial [Marinicaulis sp.]|nr:DNA polymerase III subunit delta' [Marinicaulis sp.]
MSDGNFIDPRERQTQIGRAEIEQKLRQTMADGALSSGWIIGGPKGAGKATLAYRIARGLLDPGALKDDRSFDASKTSQGVNLIANAAHPDLFILEREWDEKKSKYKTEISVDSVRELISFMNRTAAFAGARVAIVDTADDLNRNGANALLKILEEPPKNSVILLLSSTPGRLLATIRSRCKTIELRPVVDELVADLVQSETNVNKDDARTIAAHAGGRPGYALTLAMEEG